MHFADELVTRIGERGSRLVVGLDPHWDLIPESFKACRRDKGIGVILTDYLTSIIDATSAFAVAYKPQIAFFEQFGIDGLTALRNVIDHLHACNALVVMDAKRNDIGSTAAAYARTFFGDTGFRAPFPSHALTVNGYLGWDGIEPFVGMDRGIFVLAKTSNPSSGEIQDLTTQSGVWVCQEMAQLIRRWNHKTIGDSGYGNVGAVVGATYPEHMRLLRALMPESILLVPGFGTQRGSDGAIRAAFDAGGSGAVIAASRSIIFPDGFAKSGFDAVTRAAERAKDHINRIIRSGR